MVNKTVVKDNGEVDASAVLAAASEPDIPQIDPPGTGQVTLMWGLSGDSEEVDAPRQLSAEVRELNGADEEMMARLKDRSPSYFVDLVDLVLRRAVESVGDTRITPQNGATTLGELLVADRDLLFKEIILTTFGSERTYEGIRCVSCKAENDIEVDVEGLLQTVDLEGAPETLVELRDGTIVELHYPTGADQKYVYDVKEDLAQAGYNTRMIGRCIVTVDAKKLLPAQAERYALELGMADRRTIVNAIASGPSVRFKEVEVPCTECGDAIPFAFGWADLLWV